MDGRNWLGSQNNAEITTFYPDHIKHRPAIRRQLFPAEDDYPQTTPTSETQDTMSVNDHLRVFRSRTTLMGLSQITTRKGILWKIFWTLVSMSAAAMALFQSWHILQDYVNGKTIQSTTYSTVFDFPSVTLCSNIHLDDETAPNIDMTQFEKETFSRENTSHLVEYLNVLMVKENQIGISPFGPNIQIKQCKFNLKNCDIKDPEEVYHFSTVLYGNCFTYNKATKKQKSSIQNYFVTLKIDMDSESRKMEWNDNYVSVWVHPAGSAPVLHKTDDIRVYPGDSVDIQLQMKHIERLPSMESRCACSQSDPRRFSSIYFSKNAKYIYNVKACVYSLIYEIKKKTQNCLDPAIPRNEHWMEAWNSGNHNICYPGIINLNNDDDPSETMLDLEVNCSFPCREWIVDYTVSSRSAWFEGMIDRSLKNHTNQNINNIKLDPHFATVKVGLASPMIEAVSEHYKYTAGDFAGIIGGNIGVWIGLCAISLAELIELLINVIIAALRGCHKSCQVQDIKVYEINPVRYK